jgi:type VII secretion-associated serine protease mycosin
MRRLTRTAIAATLALFMVGATATPGGAAVPGPRSEEWWFTAWAVQNKVWPITQGQGVTVAVIDSGVQADLPDLAGVVVPGINAVTGSGDGRTDVDTSTPAGHGTGMASLIASQGRGTGFVGVAPRAKIMPIVAHDARSSTAGIRYAVDHGAKIINISQGSPESCAENLQQAVGYAIQHDVVVVAAAGNEALKGNYSSSPANCAGVLAVGGLNAQLGLLQDTQRQPYVAAAAPAVDVGGVLKDGLYHTARRGGTSAASALTSAAVALVRSKYPDLSGRDAVARIMATLRDTSTPGRDDATGYGAVRPYQALTIGQVPKNTPNPAYAAYDKWAAANGQPAGSSGSGASSAQHKKVEESSNDVGGLLGFVGLAVAVMLLAVLLFVFLRARNRRATAAAGPMPGYYTDQGQPQPYGRPQVPPPGFGGPTGPPPGQQGMPPGPPQGGQPGYRPRQDPPAGPGQRGPGGPPAPYGQ